MYGKHEPQTHRGALSWGQVPGVVLSDVVPKASQAGVKYDSHTGNKKGNVGGLND